MHMLAMSDPGRMRTRNEDWGAVDEAFGLALVVDGVGGNNAGDVASALAGDEIRTYIAKQPATLRGLALLHILRRVVLQAHVAVKQAATANAEHAGMAAALTLAIIRRGYLYLAHVGDTRAYRLRGGELECLTWDHTVGAAPEISDQVPNERDPSVLTQAVGLGKIQVDLYRTRWLSGDLLLLCSDGLHGAISSEALATILRDSAGDLAGTASALIAAANAAGGDDNITVVLAADDRIASALPASATPQPATTQETEAEQIDIVYKPPRPRQQRRIVQLLSLLVLCVVVYAVIAMPRYWWEMSGETPRLVVGLPGTPWHQSLNTPSSLSCSRIRALAAGDAQVRYTQLTARPFRSQRVAQRAFVALVVSIDARVLREAPALSHTGSWAVYRQRLEDAAILTETIRAFDSSIADSLEQELLHQKAIADLTLANRRPIQTITHGRDQ